jgi:UDP-N-acetylmuramoyl-tripeptide--D-alanyl-D-alanine ligase
MRRWDADRVAEGAGAEVLYRPREGACGRGPIAACVDSRRIASEELFVGLAGERVDGGEHALDALMAGAWGVLVAPGHARACAAIAREAGSEERAAEWVVLAHEQPLAGLQALAKAWLGELRAGGARVVAVTGSTGKTSTKDMIAALLGAQLRTVASPENLNTEIGLPLAILGAPAGTQALVLEMAMRGKGQIAELTRIAQPEVGLIVNVGPVHLEQLGSVQAVAAAKGELIEGLAPGATAVVPADEPLLAPYLRDEINTVTFGDGGSVQLAGRGDDGQVVIVDATPGEAPSAGWPPAEPARAEGPVKIVLRPSFEQEHNLRNLLSAVAAARALGITPAGPVAPRFSRMRGERVELPGRVVMIEDCYNANPMSMRAAIDDLAETAAARTSTPAQGHDPPRTGAHAGVQADENASPRTRRVAVLGDMLELGPDERSYHQEIGAYARARGVDLLVAVGPRAAEMAGAFEGSGQAHRVPDADAAAELVRRVLQPGDTVLVKGSRGVGLERVGEALRASELLLAER